MTASDRFRRHRRAQLLHMGLAGVLAIALVVAQTLGFLHRAVHADAGGGVAVHASETPFAAAAGEHDWIEALFAGHHGQRDCDAFDQLGHVDLAVGVGAKVAVVPTQGEVIATRRGGHIAAQACGFLARGPPVLA